MHLFCYNFRPIPLRLPHWISISTQILNLKLIIIRENSIKSTTKSTTTNLILTATATNKSKTIIPETNEVQLHELSHSKTHLSWENIWCITNINKIIQATPSTTITIKTTIKDSNPLITTALLWLRMTSRNKINLTTLFLTTIKSNIIQWMVKKFLL